MWTRFQKFDVVASLKSMLLVFNICNELCSLIVTFLFFQQSSSGFKSSSLIINCWINLLLFIKKKNLYLTLLSFNSKKENLYLTLLSCNWQCNGISFYHKMVDAIVVANLRGSRKISSCYGRINRGRENLKTGYNPVGWSKLPV